MPDALALALPRATDASRPLLELLLARAARPDPTTDLARAAVLEVSQVFGDAVVAHRQFEAGQPVTLGATLVRSLRGARLREDFFLPPDLLPTPSHALFEPAGDGWVVVLDPRWEGAFEGPAGLRRLASLPAARAPGPDGCARVPLAADDQLVLGIGGSMFVARAVRPSRRVPAAASDGVDLPLLGITAFVGVAAALLGLALSVVQPPARPSTLGTVEPVVELLLQRPLPSPEPPRPAPGEAGARARGPEGKRGAPDAPADAAHPPMTRPQRAQEVAEAAGVLGAIRSDAALDALLGESGLASAIADGLASAHGPRGVLRGAGGLGERAAGFGGGGTADTLGGFGPRGRGPGADGLAPRGGTKQEGAPASIDTGEILSVGALDKALVDAVVKRHLAQVRYCYQRELARSPDLSGSVKVRFTIAGDGSVSSATTRASTLGSPSVEGCINARFLRMQFPEPKGGGVVVVSYPFHFAPG